MRYPLTTLSASLLTLLATYTLQAEENQYFARVATVPVCTQIDAACDTDIETAAEILDYADDGNTIIYTDSPSENIGFIDISEPHNPKPKGVVKLMGEPTSVVVKGKYALVAVNTSKDYIDTSGALVVVDIDSQAKVHQLPLGGQPDSIAINEAGSRVAVAIENERNEDLGDGRVGQMPAGNMVIVDTASSDPEKWRIWGAKAISLTGLAEIAPEDPEPEYVDINANNQAVVTLQENNHLAIVDLENGSIINHFSAGTADLDNIDATESEPAMIKQTESLKAVVREPDGATWIDNEHFVTADEGDMDGGSRGFTIYHHSGEMVYTSGSELEYRTAALGHYPDERSENKGNEPENAEFAVFDDRPYLFVNSERSSLVFVYKVSDPSNPEFVQALPTAAAPEGVKAIPERGLLVVASEEDDREDKMRSAVNIYTYGEAKPHYPSIRSELTAEQPPIPWAALSGLAASEEGKRVYSINDSFLAPTRIYEIDRSQSPAVITKATPLKDTNDVLASMSVSASKESATRFDQQDLQSLIMDDQTVSLDAEGIALASDGGFWIASEGAGTIGNTEDRPIEKPNMIVKASADGVIEKVITLPEDMNAKQRRFGFEGVTEYDGALYVAMQRAWGEEKHPKIARYQLESQSWDYFDYPLEDPASANGGWVGLSAISAIGDDQFLVLERDNQAGPDAAIKRVYQVELTDQNVGKVLEKTLIQDLLESLQADGQLVYEKIEGLASTAEQLFIINDNDGVDDNSGETQLLVLDR